MFLFGIILDNIQMHLLRYPVILTVAKNDKVHILQNESYSPTELHHIL